MSEHGLNAQTWSSSKRDAWWYACVVLCRGTYSVHCHWYLFLRTCTDPLRVQTNHTAVHRIISPDCIYSVRSGANGHVRQKLLSTIIVDNILLIYWHEQETHTYTDYFDRLYSLFRYKWTLHSDCPQLTSPSADFIITSSQWKQLADIGVHPDTTEREILSGDIVFFLLNHWIHKPVPMLGSFKYGLSVYF
jgi:hypothetical protein